MAKVKVGNKGELSGTFFESIRVSKNGVIKLAPSPKKRGECKKNVFKN